MNSIPWKDILGWNEDLIHALRCTGFTYLKQGKYDKARLFFEGLITIDPMQLYDLRTLAGIYIYLGDNRRALQMLNRALQIEKKHYPTLLNRAKALLLLGMRQEGLEAAKALQTCPEKEIANDASALILAYR